MRPIHLRFSGLQSYKEPQEIDFERLTEVGLFGIFGPTGSGKSTILDAITLALFGRVERAGNGIQGIMNMQSNQLSVSFAFALGERLFRAERSYRRQKSGQVILSGTRLIEGTDDESVVLAEQNVAEVVTDLIGLNVQDFTRAVVLPQGKFAEFLTLTGGERRGMLERLFGLSAYGRQLSERARGRFAETSAELEKVEAQKQTLGDASQGALVAAKGEYQAAAILAEQKERELELAQKSYEQGEQLLKLQEELGVVQESHQQQLALGPKMEELERELASAEKAEPLRHLLTSYQEAQKDLEQALERTASARAVAEKAQADFQQAKAHALSVAQTIKAEEPQLLQRRGELEVGVKLEEELGELAIERRELGQKLLQLKALLVATEQELRLLKEKRRQLEEELKTLGQRRGTLTVSAQEREFLGEVGQKLQIMKQHEGELTLAHEKHQQALAAFREAREKLAKTQRILKEQKARSQELAEQNASHSEKAPAATDLDALAIQLAALQHAVEKVDALSSEEQELRSQQVQREEELEKAQAEVTALAEELTADKEELARLQAAKEEALTQELAQSLAQKLAAGEPCPVCGSCEHPRPREHAELTDYTAPLAAFEKEMEAKNAQLIRRDAQRENLQGQKREAEEKLKALAEKLALEWEKLPSLWQGKAPTELWDLFREQEAAYLKAKEENKLWREAEQKLRDEVAACQRELAAQEKGEAALAATVAAYEKSLDQAHKELVTAQENLYQSREEFASLAGSMTPQAFEARQGEVQSWDRELEALAKAQEQLETELKETRTQEELLAQKQKASELELATVGAQETELAKKQSQLGTRLKEITEGASARELLAALDERRGLLQKEEEAAKSRAELAQKESLAAALNQERSQEAFEGAKARSERFDAELSQTLAKAGFNSKAELAASLRTEAIRAELKEQLTSFKQELGKLEQELARLKKLIGKRTLSSIEWEELKREYSEAKAGFSAAHSKKGAASEKLRQLEAQHQRWLELEVRERALKVQVKRLDSLQTVLRGNVFVDFLAEEQLAAIAQDATARLARLTGGHYSLELAADCSFVIIDHFSGNARRAVNTLSGGETFLASLALALALSSHIQLQGKFPLEFFFLDEGFGTLDPELLEIVMTALEQLQQERMTIGVISHVPELRQRLARRLYIEPAEPLGRGSRVHLEVG